MTATIHIDIPDDLLKEMGLQSIQLHLQKRIELMRLDLLAEKINKALEKSDVDWEKELKAAKERAWKKYKIHYEKARS